MRAMAAVLALVAIGRVSPFIYLEVVFELFDLPIRQRLGHGQALGMFRGEKRNSFPTPFRCGFELGEDGLLVHNSGG